MESYAVKENHIGYRDPLLQTVTQRSCYFIIRILKTTYFLEIITIEVVLSIE